MMSCSVYICGSWPGGGVIIAWEQAEDWVPGGEQLRCASLAFIDSFLSFTVTIISSSLCCPIKLFLIHEFFLSVLFLIPLWGWGCVCGVNKQQCDA